MTTTDPYETLGVASDATADEIHARYRTLARLHHPDTGGSNGAMVSLNRAWELLRIAANRAIYDATHRRIPPRQTTTSWWSSVTMPWGRHEGELLRTVCGDATYVRWVLRKADATDEYLASALIAAWRGVGNTMSQKDEREVLERCRRNKR